MVTGMLEWNKIVNLLLAVVGDVLCDGILDSGASLSRPLWE